MDLQHRTAGAGPLPVEQTPVTRTARLKQHPGTGVWSIYYSEPNPKGGGWRSRTISTRTTDRLAANTELNRFLRNEATLTRQAQVDQYSVGELIRYYIDNHASRKGETAWLCFRPIIDALGHMAPAALTPDVINAYRRTRRVKDGTVRRELGALTAAFNYCKRHNLITTTPGIDLPPTSQARLVYMDEDQERAFWDAAMTWEGSKGSGRRIRLFVALALETAARAEAILELTWDRVDFRRGLIDYRTPGRPVGKKRRTVVPISDRLLPVLQAAAEGQPATARVIGRGAIRKAWSTFTEAIGMPWVTPHVCRHTWATMAAHDGVSLLQIAQILGDTEETVARNYIHFQPSQLRHVVNRRKYPS